jgi:serine/threonine-protein kinase
MTLLEQLTADLVGRYWIERELGAGGMATVYLARDLRHDRNVALKVLLPDLAAAVGTERFLREIRTAARLSHPHILPLYDSGQAAGTLFYVMPLAEGESLRERLAREVQLPLEDALQIVREVAEALAYAHAQGIVHRDIKPENILISGGHAVVADFGIAAVLGATGSGKLTGTGMAVGTPTYMSPEQAAGERVDGRSDVYSLGCVLYELLTGTPPFTGPSVQAVVARHMADPVPSIRTVRATVPAALERAVLRALAKVPADRFATAWEFARALPRHTDLRDTRDEVPETTVETQPRGGRRWAWAAVIGTGLVLLLVVARVAGLFGHAAEASTIRSLAVLPLKNRTGDTAQMYLAEGVTDQVLTSLEQIGALRVFKMRGQTGDEATSKALKDNRVDALLEGSLYRAGNAVRITVQFTSATTGQALPGGGSYNGTLGGILNLQAEVARSIADSIRVSLTPQERSRLTTERPAVSPAAYDRYVRGTYFHGRAVVAADFQMAIGFFRQAIAADTSYAAAYAGLAGCYIDMGYLGLGPPDETFPQARVFADRALALDSTLGAAYGALAEAEFFYGWNFTAAEREFRRALELNPRDAWGHFKYSALLTAMNRSEQAISEAKLSQEFDPLALILHAAAARPYYNARRYDEAIAQSRRTLDLDSTFGRAHFWLGMTYQEISRPEDAIRELQRTSASTRMPLYLAALGHAYAVAGDRAKAEQVLGQLQEQSRSRYISPFDIATIYAGLGDRPRTLEWLEKAYQRRVPILVFLAVDPQFDAFKADPQFRDLLRRIGLSAGS